MAGVGIWRRVVRVGVGIIDGGWCRAVQVGVLIGRREVVLAAIVGEVGVGDWW